MSGPNDETSNGYFSVLRSSLVRRSSGLLEVPWRGLTTIVRFDAAVGWLALPAGGRCYVKAAGPVFVRVGWEVDELPFDWRCVLFGNRQCVADGEC